MSPDLFDLGVIAWVIAGALAGLWAGFFRSAARVGGYFLALWGAMAYHGPVGAFLAEHLGVSGWMGRFLARHLPLPVGVSTLPPNAVRWEDLIGQRLAALPPEERQWLAEKLRGAMEQAVSSGARNFGEGLYAALGRLAAEALAFLLVFAALQVLTDLAGRLLHATVGRLPLFWGANRIGGAIVGAVQHALLAALALALLAPFLGLFSPAQLEAVRQSSLGPPLLEAGRLLFRRALL